MAKILTSIHGRLVGLLPNKALSCKGITRDEDAIVNATAATLAVKATTHAGKTITLNRAGGIAVTLPAATGSGDEYEFIVGTTFTSPATIKVANATDTMVGSAVLAQDAANTVVQFAASGTDDTITFDGSTTGGLLGATVKLRDIKLDGTTAKWLVDVVSEATGTEATPFSATV